MSVVRFTDSFINLDFIPALKCWAILTPSALRTKPSPLLWAKHLWLNIFIARLAWALTGHTFLDLERKARRKALSPRAAAAPVCLRIRIRVWP